MSSTAGDYIDGVLSNQGASLILVFVIGLVWAYISGSAPNQFMVSTFVVLSAFSGAAVGIAYGKRSVYRNIGQQSTPKETAD